MHPNIGEHRGGEPPGRCPLVEGGNHVGRGRDRHHDGRRHYPGVVVDEVEDLHIRPIGQCPVGHVRLPGLVGQGRLEPCPGRPRPLLGLGDDEPPSHEHPVDGGSTGCHAVAMAEVVLDAERAGVESLLLELLAEGHDLVLDLDGSLRRTSVRSLRPEDECLVAAGVESDDLLGHPRLRHVERRGHRSERPTLQHHGIDCVTGTVHGHHLSRCPRCRGTCCPLSDGTRHTHGPQSQTARPTLGRTSPTPQGVWRAGVLRQSGPDRVLPDNPRVLSSLPRRARCAAVL